MKKLPPFETTGTNKDILMQFVLTCLDLLNNGSGRALKCLWFRIKKTTIYPVAQASNRQHEFIILKPTL